MSIEQQARHGVDKFLPPASVREQHTIDDLERELALRSSTEIRLREGLAHQEDLLCLKDAQIRQQEILIRESEHRLLNGLQMIVSLLMLQGRAAANSDVATQLAVAANRVGTIERIHRRLRRLDGAQTVAFKPYLEDLCRDVCSMLSPDACAEHVVDVHAIDIDLPASIASPLGFIVNELLTNALKYGEGTITVLLRMVPRQGVALSVSNGGRALPAGFDPGASKGLGMRIVMSFVARIGGDLRLGPGDDGHGTCVTVMFPG